jgi:hypothetical protein
MRLRTLAANLTLSGAALVALALLLELLLQFAVPLVYRPRFTKIDASLGWYHNRSVSTVSKLEGHEYRLSYNSHGYRPPEHSFEKPSGLLRVEMLGDSFVDGSEVGDEELFTWHLQQTLHGAEIINLGVYGYSTAQEVITLERVGVRYDPDLVVLVTMTNDFWGNATNLSYFGPAPRFVLDGDSVRLEPTTSGSARAAFKATNLPVPGMSFLHRHSLVYYLLNHSLYQPLIASKINAIQAAQRQALSAEDRLELYRRLVRRMKRLCDERGIDFLVILAYERSELRKGDVSPNSRLAQVLEMDSVRTVDLYAALRDAEQASDSSLYYRGDIHWNARGHQVVAELLRPSLEQWMRERAGDVPVRSREDSSGHSSAR